MMKEARGLVDGIKEKAGAVAKANQDRETAELAAAERAAVERAAAERTAVEKAASDRAAAEKAAAAAEREAVRQAAADRAAAEKAAAEKAAAVQAFAELSVALPLGTASTPLDALMPVIGLSFILITSHLPAVGQEVLADQQGDGVLKEGVCFRVSEPEAPQQSYCVLFIDGFWLDFGHPPGQYHLPCRPWAPCPESRQIEVRRLCASKLRRFTRISKRKR